MKLDREMADAERKMCLRGGRKETKFRSDGAIARCGISKTGSNGSDTVCGILPELHMGWLPGGPSSIMMQLELAAADVLLPRTPSPYPLFSPA
eukprot:4463706-Prymnesium_polylepis.1